MKKYQVKGVFISALFILLVSWLGFDLGRIFWIGLVLFIALIGIYYIVWIAVKAIRGAQD
jgi:lipopolysaccharide export LptBFGC system permease protein LptF